MTARRASIILKYSKTIRVAESTIEAFDIMNTFVYLETLVRSLAI